MITRVAQWKQGQTLLIILTPHLTKISHLFPLIPSFFHVTAMKFAKLNPKRLFRSKHRSPLSTSSNGGRKPTTVHAAVSGDYSGELAQAFRLIDQDNDGIVSAAELQALLARLSGAAAPGVAALVGGECISVEELARRVGARCEAEEVRGAFAVFDLDGDGRISAKDLLRVFAAIGDERCTLEECRRMIEGVDRNGDGFVCFEDFSRMMSAG
ncbi:hypothetical protein Fmac_025078 [Flemingia macrophylla]|uniref:EF-hand domain-containing protein n=1 Tax=Flemingia macrophylla TaxID=520843 RepID=A0ABD1LR83_9FABA